MVEKTSQPDFSKKDTFKIVQHLADVLEDIMKNSNKKSIEPQSIFTSKNLNPPKLRDFILKLFIKLEMELSTLVCALSYMDCFNLSHPLNPKNIHNVVSVAMEIACKYNEDVIFDFESIAYILEIEVRKLAKMEVEFLEAIDYEVHLNKELYEDYYSVLV